MKGRKKREKKKNKKEEEEEKLNNIVRMTHSKKHKTKYDIHKMEWYVLFQPLAHNKYCL